MTADGREPSDEITVNGGGATFLQLGTAALTVPITVAQGTLDGTGTVGAVTINNAAAAMIANGNGSSGTLTTTGNLAFRGAATANLFLPASGTPAVAGGFGIAGPGTLTKNNAGAVTLNTSNSYAGGTTLNAGTLNLGNAAALGTGSANVSGGVLAGNGSTGSGRVLINGGTAGTGASQTDATAVLNTAARTGPAGRSWTRSSPPAARPTGPATTRWSCPA